MPSQVHPEKTIEGSEEEKSAKMSDTIASDTTVPTTTTSPVPRPAKRDNEGNPKTETAAPAVAETATKPPITDPKPSPTSEVKKQNAAVSLTQLFTNTQDSLTSCESGTNDTLGEAGNFLAECFSGDGDGEHGHLAVDPNAAAVPAAEGENTTPTMGNTEATAAGQVADFTSPRKKSKRQGVAVSVKTEGDVAVAQGKSQETPLAMKAGAYRLNKLMEATKFTSPIPEQPTHEQPVPVLPDIQEEAIQAAVDVQLEPQKPITHNRKEKSLALLCQNFMDLCRDAPPCGENDESGALVELNELATHLGVKRRRIYDIINIMESVKIVSRLKKNTYRWHGTDKLPLYFARLQREGLAELRSNIPRDTQIKGMSLTCQKLVQYFLTTGIMEIRLSDAAEAVLGPSQGEDKSFKTKIRRMYDIANVLTSLGIIKKENVAGNSSKAQPSFRWVYPIHPQDMSQHLPAEEQTGKPVELIPHQHHPQVPDVQALNQEVTETQPAQEESVAVLPEQDSDDVKPEPKSNDIKPEPESQQAMVSV